MSKTGKTRLARRKSFQCLHRYANADWTEERNLATFGACFTPHGHGHNYDLDVYLEGPIAADTGMILNLIDVDALMERVIAPLRGKHLNFEVPAFRDQVPTTEALARYLFDALEPQVPAPARLTQLRLYESEALWVDVWAE